MRKLQEIQRITALRMILTMSKYNCLISLVLATFVTAGSSAFAQPRDAGVSQDAQQRATIRQNMQQRSLEQRLDSQANSRRVEDSVDRAVRDQRRARDRAIGK